MINDHDLRFQLASEDELVDIMSGTPMSLAYGLPDLSSQRIPPRMTGVFSLERPDGSPPKPVILVVREEDQKRLFVRFSQNRNDLSPISAWCHVIPSDFADRLHGQSVYPNFNGYTAAWCGLAVAEASVMMDRSVGRLTLNPCLGTQTFAVARSSGLWGFRHHGEVISRYEVVRRSFGAQRERSGWMRNSLENIWAALLSASTGVAVSADRAVGAVGDALRVIHDEGGVRDTTAKMIAPKLLGFISEAIDIADVSKMPSKRRLELFDRLVEGLRQSRTSGESSSFTTGAFLCGFLANVMAGGAASFTVAEALAGEFPEVLAWAYIVGSVGERVTWTASFDGLGRLISRELERPYHLMESPTADISFEEAIALIDPGLSDRFVHLRLKGGRIATVSLLPGVETTVSVDVASSVKPDLRGSQTSKMASPSMGMIVAPSSSNDALTTALVDALWPKISERLGQIYFNDEADQAAKTQGKTTPSKAGRSPASTNRKG